MSLLSVHPRVKLSPEQGALWAPTLEDSNTDCRCMLNSPPEGQGREELTEERQQGLESKVGGAPTSLLAGFQDHFLLAHFT